MMGKVSFVKEKGCFWNVILINKRVSFNLISKGSTFIYIGFHIPLFNTFLWIFSFELQDVMVKRKEQGKSVFLINIVIHFDPTF